MLNGTLKFTIRGGVSTIEFLNGFNICLGLSKRKYHIVDSVLFAESEPYLRHGINSMYVYWSIVQPIRVGNVCVPLLKSVWLDRGGGKNTSHSFGEVCNIRVKNPMYLPVSSTSISSIEVNIRSDSGRLIPFVEGSITSLTLHFKRKWTNSIVFFQVHHVLTCTQRIGQITIMFHGRCPLTCPI